MSGRRTHGQTFADGCIELKIQIPVDGVRVGQEGTGGKGWVRGE